jgi:F-type H+-transporting ATPase subunit b
MISFRSFAINMPSAKRIALACATTLLVATLGGLAASVHAQEQSSPSPSQPESSRPQPSGMQSAEPQSPEARPSQERLPNRSHEPGFARQLTHETREAAGEENDETAEFKQSPAVQFIARITGLSVAHAYMLSVFLNFGVVAVCIIWAAAKYLPRIFSARTAAIQKSMQEAQKAGEEARRKLTDIESRLQKLDMQIAMMRDTAEKEAADDEARIRTSAEEEKRKIVESAQHEIAAAAKSARRELTAFAADLAVALAKKQIRVDAATDQALVRNFAGDLGVFSATGHGSTGKDKH